MHRDGTTHQTKSTFLPRVCRQLLASLAGLLLLVCMLGMLQLLRKPAGQLEVALADSGPVVFTDVTTLADVDLTAPQWGAVWGDYDKDGYEDLYVGNHFNTPSLYHNNGDGTFTDVRAAAGIKSGPADWHGAAWGDYDNDGYLDLYVVTGRAIVNGSDFYVNNGDGTFAEQAVQAGITNDDGRGRVPRWVDYDQDGDLDIFVANAPRDIAPNALYRNNMDGTFSDVAVQAGVSTSDGSRSVAWSDYDDDGHPDFVLTMIGNPLRLYHNRGDGTFEDATSSAGLANRWPRSVAWGDYDNDGDLDLYLNSAYEESHLDKLVWDAQTIMAIVKTPTSGSGGHQGLIFTSTVSAVTFDLWQSDRQHETYEIHLGADRRHPASIPFTLDNSTSDHIGVPVYAPGVEYGVFIWRETATSPWKIYWSGDGARLHGAITTAGEFSQVISDNFEIPADESKPNYLYRNDGDGTFTNVTNVAEVGDSANTYDAQWIDFDNDGYLDLYVNNYGSTYFGNQPNRLYRNDGDGTFSDVAGSVRLQGPTEGWDQCAAWADYDDDGFLDVFISNTDWTGYLAGPHKLYLNGGNANHWLIIKPIGTDSNKLGIGAKIQVKTGDQVQFREVGGGSSGPCQNSLLAHFGLGNYGQAEAITITWPSGHVMVVHDVAADQVLQVAEGMESDLSVAQACGGPDTIEAGQAITYTISLTNAGPSSPAGATLVDTFSDADALAAVSGPGCAWTPGSASITCAVTDLVGGVCSDLTLVVTTSHTYSGVLSSVASVTLNDGVIDPDISNNETDSVVVTVIEGSGGDPADHVIYMPVILR